MMSGMKEMKTAGQSVVRFMSLDWYCWRYRCIQMTVTHTVSAGSSCWNVLFPRTMKAQLIYLQRLIILSVLHLFILCDILDATGVFWNGTCAVGAMCMIYVAIVFLHFQLTHNRPYLPQLLSIITVLMQYKNWILDSKTVAINFQ